MTGCSGMGKSDVEVPDSTVERDRRRPETWSVVVVMPARNAALQIGDQLEALASQKFSGSWRVVVVDNGSTDATAAVAQRFEPQFPSLTVLDASDACSAAQARNVGSREASDEELIAYCDADDVVAPGWISGLEAHAIKDAIVAGSFDEDSLNDPIVRQWIDSPAHEGMTRHLGFLPMVRTANMAIPARLLRQLGGWPDVAYGEDVEFSWDAQLAGYRVVFAEDARVAYRFRHDLRGLARQAFRAGDSDARLYAKYSSRGLSSPSFKRTLRVWGWLLVYLPLAPISLRWRGRWIRAAAYRVGRLKGSLRHRVAAL